MPIDKIYQFECDYCRNVEGHFTVDTKREAIRQARARAIIIASDGRVFCNRNCSQEQRREDRRTGRPL